MEKAYTIIRDIPTGEVVRLDFKCAIESGKIRGTSINVSILENSNSIDIYRVDTNHGYLHEHRFWKNDGPERLNMSYDKAFIEKKREVLESYRKWIILFKKNRG